VVKLSDKDVLLCLDIRAWIQFDCVCQHNDIDIQNNLYTKLLTKSDNHYVSETWVDLVSPK